MPCDLQFYPSDRTLPRSTRQEQRIPASEQCSNPEVAMAGRTGAARITAGSLDLASTIQGWELHVRAGGRSPATLDNYLRGARPVRPLPRSARDDDDDHRGSPGSRSRRRSPSSSSRGLRRQPWPATRRSRSSGPSGRDLQLAVLQPTEHGSEPSSQCMGLGDRKPGESKRSRGVTAPAPLNVSPLVRHRVANREVEEVAVV